MDKFINRTKGFLFARQSSIVSSAMLISVMIIASSFFGFLRYRILASYFTANDLDIFFASFKLPDIIYEILITGAVTATFIPIFIKYQSTKQELDDHISAIINFISLLLAVFIVILLIFMDRLVPFIAPGYTHAKVEKIIYFSRLLLLGQLPFMVLGNFLTGIGQANKTFLLSAVAPVIYNISIIVVTVLFASSFSLLAPVMGVIAGAALFFLVQLPLLSDSGYTYRFLIKKTAGLIDFVRMVIPRTFTVIVAQIDATIDLTLTTFLGGGAYTFFYLAQHLQLLPVSVIGIAFSQASLPYLSEIYQTKRMEEFKKIVVSSILNLFFLTIPIMCFFAFARTPLIRLFFGGQKFDWNATVTTAITLSYFSIALPLHSIYYFLTRCFYAILDSRTPFYISVISILINTSFSLLFVFVLKLPVWALAISFSVAMIINSTTLFVILSRRLTGLDINFLIRETAKMLTAAAISSGGAYYLMKILDTLVFDTSRTINIFFLLIIVLTVYSCTYLLLSWILEIKEIYLISQLLIKARHYQKRIVEIYTSYE